MRRVSNAITIGFTGLAAFQAALAAGAPLGDAAWGGAHATLPTSERIGSALAVGVYVVGIVVTRGRAAGMLDRRYRWGAWMAVAILGLSAVANFASDSPWENYILAPIGIVLGALCFVVARAPNDTSARRSLASPTTRRPHLPA
jgi:peptidoglycan/LPS O-acetylase OafA/YrhL